ncbi:MAG: hypothetical protein GY845_20340 [Planctomycetes bacterium]|nr:hypothetical protein [Planctomycetota bacterium]
MKKFLFVLGIVILTAAIFTGGMSAGAALDWYISMYAVSQFENESLNASNTFMVVKMLDENKVDDAKAYLNLTLYAKIMAVGMLVSECPNDKSKRMATRILARIARHRQEHPVPPRDKQVDDLTRDYLTKAIAEVEKQEKQNKAINTDSQ